MYYNPLHSDDESPPPRRYLNRLSSSPGLGEPPFSHLHKTLPQVQPDSQGPLRGSNLKLSVKTNGSGNGNGLALASKGRGLDLQRFS
jgi:hypothetical protein